MKQRFFSGLAVLLLSLTAQAQTEVRLAVHKSFSLPPDVLAQFERKHDAKVSVIKVGSSNEMLNKLILSRAQPIADAVYGLDNANIGKADQSGILAAAFAAGRCRAGRGAGGELCLCEHQLR